MTSEYRWLTPESQQFLSRGYLLPGQTVDQRVDVICNRAEELLGMPGFAARLKSAIQKGWISLSTPIWTNFGHPTRGLPISCFGSDIEDSMEGILATHAEVGVMTKHGGGTSAFFGKLRGRGATIKNNGTSFGSVHFMQLFETLINVVSQGNTRRGSFAAYLPIEHPDILEFLKVKEAGNALQNIFPGVTVSDEFMHRVIAREPESMKVWAAVLDARKQRGLPYIIFTGNVMRGAPEVYKDTPIRQSNLCTEIFLPNGPDESFVCDLSSLNMRYWHEWKDSDVVETIVFLLDAVMTEFIEKGRKHPDLHRAVRFAERHRALGVGWLGWHTLLQEQMIAFDSFEAKMLNVQIAKLVQERAYAASQRLATLFGEPEVCRGTGRRNTTLLAVAPTQSSAFILGQVSEGIEPILSNFYVTDKAKSKETIKNRTLAAYLDTLGKNTPEVWDSIARNRGSVQHLDFLDQATKDVFKTRLEIGPKEVIIQAAQRQKYIDQGQSTNILVHPSVKTSEVNKLMIFAWEQGIKSLYYQHSVNAAQELSRDINTCASCSA